ncbi:MAG: hypothetical protein SFX74_10170, partial [Fimbriimonadaceae bacterium]|nr:hypothetical protein [Fimbriimonadaceae bacterium]
MSTRAQPGVSVPKSTPRVRRRPLSAATYLLRNAGKSIPLTGVIVLAVMLVASIIAMINSIPLSIRTIYGYSKYFTGVTPRGDASKTATILREIKAKSPVPIERVIVCRSAATVVQSIVGKWPYYAMGMSEPDMRYLLERMNVAQIEGRYPKPGAPEAILSRPAATNLGLRIGDELLGPQKDDGFSPNSVRVVG